MTHISVESDGLGSGTHIKCDGEPMRHVRSFRFAVDAAGLTEIDVEYLGAAFNLEGETALLHCIGTELNSDQEVAVLAYLKDKYE